MARRVRYDNERGKGDHKHLGGQETHYSFIDVDHLVADFHADIRKDIHEHRHD